MGQCGSNRNPSDATLTSEDVEYVQKSWKKVYSDWNSKYGKMFYIRLFKNQPETKTFFRKFNNLSDAELMGSAELQAHAIVFGAGMDSFVQNLTNTETLVHLIQKMTDNHTARGITIKHFTGATQELLAHIADILKLTKAQRASWLKVITAVDTIIQDRINQTK